MEMRIIWIFFSVIICQIFSRNILNFIHYKIEDFSAFWTQDDFNFTEHKMTLISLNTKWLQFQTKILDFSDYLKFIKIDLFWSLLEQLLMYKL